MKCSLIIIGILFYTFGFAYADKSVICYHGTWSTYRYGNGKFSVEDIDPHLCTHLIYSFFGINVEGTLRIIDPYLDLEDNWGRGNIRKFNALKQINPKLKTMAAVGGWNEGSYRFSQVARHADRRLRFAQDAADFCIRFGFDGLDLDWEYPAQRDGDPLVDKANFVLMARDLRNAFDRYGLILSAGVAAAEFSASISYDIRAISQYFHFFNLMAYDFHGPWDNTIGINAPLFAGPNDVTPLQRQLNTDAAVNYWIREGAPREKIMLGVPFYGRSFTLSNANQNSVGSPNNGPGLAGPYTNEPGNMGYNEFCEKQLSTPWTIRWEAIQKVPYAFLGNQWIGYDDAQSITLKSQYVKDGGLGGIMIWSIETDDFHGICRNGKNPLLTVINRNLQDGWTPAPTMPTAPTVPTIPTTPGVTVPTQPPDQLCWEDGVFRDPNDCAKFYICHGGQPYFFTCPIGLVFDPAIGSCNWPEHVQC